MALVVVECLIPSWPPVRRHLEAERLGRRIELAVAAVAGEVAVVAKTVGQLGGPTSRLWPLVSRVAHPSYTLPRACLSTCHLFPRGYVSSVV